MVYDNLLNASFRFISYRPRSEKEIRYFLQKKLEKWKQKDEQEIEKVVDRLRDFGHIDDQKFIQWWVGQRKEYRQKGKSLLIRELLSKGIVREDIEQYFSSEITDETDLAKRSIQKKLELWKKLPNLEQKKKIYGYLGRRGFDAETIRQVIRGWDV